MSSRQSVRVGVVARAPRTREEAEAYLGPRGVEVRTGASIAELGALDDTIVVVFPDDFDDDESAPDLAALRTNHPNVLILIVTRDPRRFASATVPRDGSVTPRILPRPIFAWLLLDAIRAGAGRA